MYNILQWNCSRNDSCDEQYLMDKLTNIDICIMQRCPDRFLNIVKEKFQNIFCEPHSNENNLVVATNIDNAQSKTYKLPNYDLAEQTNDRNQGSIAQSININDLQLINFQIVYENNLEIKKHNRILDIEYIFNNINKNKNVIMTGDLHMEPNLDNETQELIEQNQFISNTDDIITFTKTDNTSCYGFRHDRVLTKGNISTSNFESYIKSNSNGNTHWIFTYKVGVTNDY